MICTVLAHDQENDPDIVSMIGASAALTLSGVPFLGPIAGARVGYRNGEFLLNPTCRELLESELDLVVAGTRDAVMMVESEAKELPEETMLGAVLFGQQQFQPVIDLIIALAQECAKEPWELEVVEDGDLQAALAAQFEARLREAYAESGKQSRHERVDAVRADALAALGGAEGELEPAVLGGFKKLEKAIVRNAILDTGRRIDGRDTSSVRPIAVEVGVLPRVHGSGLFTRGETQALVVATLGTGQDEQIIDALEGDYREHFLLHYNFPPYSVGEASMLRSPGRREIGHGKLAWRAIRPLLPPRESFPYTIRVVSEITEFNGSSSMATVCGSSLALMDAGVPLGRPVAGIAMGLIKEGERIAVLSDILGDEDHLGDMDFKVAGTEVGVTSLQMDIKIAGITEAIMRQALTQARDGRLHILGEMAKGISGARPELRESVPRISVIQIPQDKIGAVIGPGGKMIREICEKTGAKIDIEDDGKVKIASSDALGGPAGGRLDPGPDQRARGRRDLHRHGGAGRGFRRLHQVPRRSGRALPYLRAAQRARRQGERRRQGGRHRQGQGAERRRSRQGQAHHAGHRSGDRRGDRAGGASTGARGPGRRAAGPRPAPSSSARQLSGSRLAACGRPTGAVRAIATGRVVLRAARPHMSRVWQIDACRPPRSKVGPKGCWRV